MHASNRIWQPWWAWFPVWPIDDDVHWLENVWRKRDSDIDRWVYRSFRAPEEKEIEESERLL